MSTQVKTPKPSKADQYESESVSSTNIVKLDDAAISSLNLFVCQSSSTLNSSNVSKQTLFGLLNHCKTRCGREVLTKWIREPLFDLEKLQERQKLVEFFVDSAPGRSELPAKLRVLPDIAKLSVKLLSSSVSLNDLYATHLTISSIEGFSHCLGGLLASSPKSGFIKDHFIDPLNECQEQLDQLKTIVNRVIDFAHYRLRKELRISPKYDEKLAEMIELRNELDKKLDALHKRAISDSNVDALKLICLPDETYVFACTKKASENFRQLSKKYKEVHTQKKDQKRFTCDALDELNPQLSSALSKYRRREEEILADIGQKTSVCCSGLDDLCKIYTLLDVCVALATTAASSNEEWVKPQLHPPGNRVIKFKALRHPCVEVNRDIPYIPNDVNLGEKRLLILTGPNMGGKSTYIRSIGLAVLLAQIGSFVPAKEAIISIVDGIYTRIGAGDRQLQGNSTFMAEMVETSSILKSATDKSLIMIDELGRGTSTYDGFGIAWSVAHHIATELKSFCLFASHFFELPKLEDEVATVGNLHVSVYVDPQSQDVKMTYKIKDGKCLNSYGVIMAKSAKFPDEVITVAEEKLQDLECTFNGVRINSRDAMAKLQNVDWHSIPDDKLQETVTRLILEKGE